MNWNTRYGITNSQTLSFRDNWKKISNVSMLLTLILVSLSFSGTTGKISGKVIDKNTNEPLIGANVIVEGTVIGGITDIEGNFVILNVPPDMYKIKASMIGYTPMAISKVRVYIDQTASINFSLEMSSVIADEVVVVAPREIVRRDVATSVASVSTQEIKTLPVTTVSGIVAYQAGVEGGGTVIRGGDASQMLFLVDGITMRDPRNNQPVSSVAMSSVQEISIERGGFNAEYGQLRSGVVNVISKEGNPSQYDFTASTRVRNPGAKYSGISPFDANSMWLRPYLDPDVAWVGTQNGKWDEFTRRQYPQFDGWNEISRRLLADADSTNDLSPAAAKRLFEWQHRKREQLNANDYEIDAGFGGPIPFLSRELGDARFFLSYRRDREMLLIPLTRSDYTEDVFSGRLISNITSALKLDVSGSYGTNHTIAVNGTEQATSTDYIRSPFQIAASNSFAPFTSESRIFLDSYYSLAEISHKSIAGKLTYLINPTSYADVQLEYFNRKYFTEPQRSRNTSKIYEIYPGIFTDEAPFGWSSQPDVGVNGMLLGGHTSTARDNTTSSAVTLKSNLVTQINSHNEIKAGVELTRNDLKMDYGIVNLVFPESNRSVKWNANPLRGAFYLHDKLEYDGFISNVGVRFDYSDPNVAWPVVGEFNKNFFSAGYSQSTVITSQKSEYQLTISPRLSISHPITENSKLFFNYGHFKQLPTYEQLLRLARGASNELKLLGDPNLRMEKTIAYELGFDQSFFEMYLFQVAAFYRDITDQQDNTTFRSADGSIIYSKVTNDSYEDVRGFEVTLRKSVGDWWAGFANYTYQVSSSGRFNRAQVWEDPSEQRNYDRDTRLLYQFRPIPTPFARFNLAFFTPTEFGPDAGGIQPLGKWNLSLLGDWRAGSVVTFNPKNIPSIINNIESVDWYNLNLRLSKDITFGSATFTFLMDLNNVLNTKRLSMVGFYDFNDNLDYYNSLHLPGSTAYDNIVGEDRSGDFRDPGTEFVPIVQIGSIAQLNATQKPNTRALYYVKADAVAGTAAVYKYFNLTTNAWSDVPADRLNKVLDDKAYIDMPNQTSFNFLDPREIFFGMTVSFNF